jgi:hypothetical protein
MTIRALTLTALAGAALAVSACGSSDGGGSTGATKDPQEAALKFAQCMREHGVDMPDPQLSSSGGITMRMRKGSGSKIDPSSPAFENAQKACEQYQPKAPSSTGTTK